MSIQDIKKFPLPFTNFEPGPLHGYGRITILDKMGGYTTYTCPKCDECCRPFYNNIGHLLSCSKYIDPAKLSCAKNQKFPCPLPYHYIYCSKYPTCDTCDHPIISNDDMCLNHYIYCGLYPSCDKCGCSSTEGNGHYINCPDHPKCAFCRHPTLFGRHEISHTIWCREYPRCPECSYPRLVNSEINQGNLGHLKHYAGCSKNNDHK